MEIQRNYHVVKEHLMSYLSAPCPKSGWKQLTASISLHRPQPAQATRQYRPGRHHPSVQSLEP